MIQAVIETIFDVGFQGIGWAVLKGITFGRYRGFQPEDLHLEGTVGFATVALVCYGVYWLLFRG
jgi:hypothetical protein